MNARFSSALKLTKPLFLVMSFLWLCCRDNLGITAFTPSQVLPAILNKPIKRLKLITESSERICTQYGHEEERERDKIIFLNPSWGFKVRVKFK